MPWMKPFPFLCPQASNGAAVVPAAKGWLPPSPSVTCSVVRPTPRSGSVEADPAYRAGSSGGFCHHMADPGPAASPGVACTWIRVTIQSIRLSLLPLYPQQDCTDVVSANSWKMWTTVRGWKRTGGTSKQVNLGFASSSSSYVSSWYLIWFEKCQLVGFSFPVLE